MRPNNQRSLLGSALRRASVFMCAAIASLTLIPSAGAKGKITTFDVPGATGTTPYSINAYGAITGTWYSNTDGGGFVRAADGTTTTFKDSTDDPHLTPYGINDAGAITGTNDAYQSCFLRTPDGTVTTFYIQNYQTHCRDINDKGVIAGYYWDGNNHAFVRSAKGRVTRFDAGQGGDTIASSINRSGYVTGAFTSETGATVAFIRSPDGTIESFTLGSGANTEGVGINDSAAVAGWYAGTDNQYHSFVRINIYSLTQFDPPGAVGSQAASIDRQGRVAGYYRDSGGVEHGYVRSADGTFTTFDVPAASDTHPLSISEGAVTGWYANSDGSPHGFSRAK